MIVTAISLERERVLQMFVDCENGGGLFGRKGIVILYARHLAKVFLVSIPIRNGNVLPDIDLPEIHAIIDMGEGDRLRSQLGSKKSGAHFYDILPIAMHVPDQV